MSLLKASRYPLYTLVLLAGSFATVAAQPIAWTDITGTTTLPAGVRLFSGNRVSPPLSAWYLDVDMNEPTIAVRPYLTSTPANVASLTAQAGALASVNGGVFGGAQSLSSVVYPFEVKAQNVPAVTRNAQSYPVIRSFFGIDTDRKMRVGWIYHYDATVEGIRTFDAPIPYVLNDPSPRQIPSITSGSTYPGLLVGIGGVPTLVKGGAIAISYNEEIVWGSGIATDTAARDPRTAVGYTPGGHIIMLVADGRGVNGSDGLSLAELARVFIDRGCVEAMNLDGGGSTQMAVGGTTINGQSSRDVPSILSVVYADSMNLPTEPTFEQIIDTEDPGCALVGTGWFNTANAGFYGGTPSKLNPTGDGSAYAVFTPSLPKAATYTVYAWWVASSNRCPDTPFIIRHEQGMDTVRVNQVLNGSQWAEIGSYRFAADGSDSVTISNMSSAAGTYVVADAVRFVSYEPGLTGVRAAADPPEAFRLEQNYPNPFNPSTDIRFQISADRRVRLSVYDLLGREIAVLIDGHMTAGEHVATWNAQGLASGVYYGILESGGERTVRNMVLVR